MAKTIIKDLDTGQVFRSKDELYISWYFEELKQLGYVDKWAYEPKSFLLGEGELSKRIVKYEQKQTKVSQLITFPSIIRKHSYTPDFLVQFNEKAKNIFYSEYDNVMDKKINITLYKRLIAVLEVKFIAGKFQGSKAKTNISRKWLLDKKDIFCQEIDYKSLFFKSFTPKRFITKDDGRMKFTQGFKMFTSESYIESRLKSINNYLTLKQKHNEQ